MFYVNKIKLIYLPNLSTTIATNSFKKKSKIPRKNDTNREIRITTIVNAIAWLRVGQLTCLSSVCVSCKYVMRLMDSLRFNKLSLLKNPSGGISTIVLFPMSLVNPVVDFDTALTRGQSPSCVKIHYGVNPNKKSSRRGFFVVFI